MYRWGGMECEPAAGGTKAPMARDGEDASVDGEEETPVGVDYLHGMSSRRATRNELEQIEGANALSFLLLEGETDEDTAAVSSAQLPILWEESSHVASTTLATSDDELVGEEGEEERTQKVPPFSKRRTKVLQFTCNLCQTRMEKNVNPHAWKHGTIVVRCEGCGVKHELIDNLGVFNPPARRNKKKKRTPSSRSN